MNNDALNAKINTGSVWAPYQEFTRTIPAGSYDRINYVTDNFVLLEVSANNALEVNFGGAVNQTNFTAGIQYKLTEPVPYIQLHNASTSPLVVHFAVGVGDVKDNRLTLANTKLNITETYTYMDVLRVTIPVNATGTTISAPCEKIMIQNVGTTTVYLGASDGIEILAGGSMDLPYSGDFVLYGTDTTSPTVVIIGFGYQPFELSYEYNGGSLPVEPMTE